VRLQKAPIGLLGAFDLKNQGQNPNEFSETVVPTFDASTLYLGRRVEESSNTSTGEVAAASVQLDVDDKHLWLMRAASARFNFTALSNSADEQWRFTLQYINRLGGAQFYLATETVLVSTLALPLGAAATVSIFLHKLFERPFLLLPGASVQASCSATMSAGSYSIDLRVDTFPVEV